MSDMHRLDIDSFPLHGVRLIEASAGTGKTFTIAALYLRLLLDAEPDLGRDLDIKDILVVTFTEAATEELRERIGWRLRDAAAAFVTGRAPEDDPLLGTLLTRRDDHHRCAQRLAEMITRLDEAPIHTIHGFCNRTLRDNAFESGALFKAEFITDERPLREALIEDFWRRSFYDREPAYANWVRSEWPSPQALLAGIGGYLNRHRLCVIPEPDSDGLEGLEARFRRALEGLQRAWERHADEARQLLDSAVAARTLSGAKDAYKAEHLDALWPVWQAWLQRPGLPLPPSFALLTPQTLDQKRLKKARDSGIEPPQSPLFDAAAAIAAEAATLADRRRVQVLHGALSALRGGLVERKRHDQVLSFDDLLTTLCGALRGAHGRTLADAIAGRHPVALIDEFQDTDPEQYEIFRRIYAGRERCGLFMIGDPKQAIYSFRGADVFTYMQARRSTEAEGSRFTLGTNWRSTDSLVRGVDALFRQNPRRFIFDQDIALPPVEAAGRADEAPLMLDGVTPAGVQVWYLPRGDGKPISKTAARPLLAAACAAEIVRLLDPASNACLGEQRVQPRDIAVLVRSHHEAEEVTRALRERNIAAVHHSRDSVFVSEEAADLARILRAVAAPEDERLLRAALCTPLMGLTAAGFHDELQRGQPWEARMEAFASYRERWQSHGFLPMLHTLMHEQGIIRRVFALSDGERRMTNLLHLGELLQEAAAQQYGITGLLRWFTTQLDSAGSLGETAELRLESDEALIRIVTIHKSKGLQYPIVFLPFIAMARQPDANASPLFHGEGDDLPLTLDLGSEAIDQHRERAGREAMAEELRLLYVALTRATHCCYLAWGGFNDSEHSGLGYLLCPPDDPDAGRPVAQIAQATDDALREPWQRLEAAHGGIVTLTDLPAGDAAAQPVEAPAARGRAARLQGPVRQHWRLTSYSGLLSSHAGQHIERPDHDATEEPAEDMDRRPAAGPDLFGFPRGARTGTCLHRILELADFTDPESLAPLVGRQLAAFGFDPAWAPAVTGHLQGVLATPLDDSGLHLGQIPRSQRLDELAFFFPANGVSAAALERALPPIGDRTRPPLTFARLQGMLKGYIDLVFEHDGRFYLVDYKSNHLGDRAQDYRPPRLQASIAASRYDLQYMLYTLALHRYLRSRLPDYDYQQHCGGVLYLFLRGMAPQRGPATGVFRTRPDGDAVARLDALFAAGTTELA